MGACLRYKGGALRPFFEDGPQRLRAQAPTLGLGPPLGVSIGRLSWVGALWDGVPFVRGGGERLLAAVCRWAFTRNCHQQYCLVYGIKRRGR